MWIPPCAEASNVGSSLTVGIQSVKTMEIRPLDPLERDIQSIYRLIYEPLVYIDDEYMPQPCLAESWIPTGNGRTWTFNIRRGVTFSDGSPMTASDVVATANYILERAKDEVSAVKGYYSNLKYFIDRITATDDHTVVVRAASGRTGYGLLYAMTFPILPETEVSQINPLGTGPYILSDFDPTNAIYLDANPNWWKSMPTVQEINFVCHNTQQAVMESYEYGRVKTIFTRSIAAAQYKSGSSSLSLDYRTNQLEVLLMNQSYNKLKSLKVRQAIMHAVDPDYIASHAYYGTVHRTDTPMIAGTWMYNDAAAAEFYYDPELSRQLLVEDGWGDSNEDGILDKLGEDEQVLELKLRLLVYEEPDNDVRFAAAAIIQEELAAIGIEVEIVTETYNGALTKLGAGSFHLALCSFAMDVCPDPGFMLMSGNTGNYGRYRSSAMGDLFKKLRTSEQYGPYRDTLMEIQQQYADDCPFVCLFYRGGTVLTRLMYTTARDVRELELLRGIESFRP